MRQSRATTHGVVAIAVGFSLALAGCGSSASTPPSPAATNSKTTSSAGAANAPATGKINVSIDNYAYHPATITVSPATKVTFTNHDQTAHTATSSTMAFDSGTVKPGSSATVVLHKPGTYTYYCQFHAFMHGTIIVK